MRRIVYSFNLKAAGIFVIILSQVDFESDPPERKLLTITSEAVSK